MPAVCCTPMVEIYWDFAPVSVFIALALAAFLFVFHRNLHYGIFLVLGFLFAVGPGIRLQKHHPKPFGFVLDNSCSMTLLLDPLPQQNPAIPLVTASGLPWNREDLCVYPGEPGKTDFSDSTGQGETKAAIKAPGAVFYDFHVPSSCSDRCALAFSYVVQKPQRMRVTLDGIVQSEKGILGNGFEILYVDTKNIQEGNAVLAVSAESSVWTDLKAVLLVRKNEYFTRPEVGGSALWNFFNAAGEFGIRQGATADFIVSELPSSSAGQKPSLTVSWDSPAGWKKTGENLYIKENLYWLNLERTKGIFAKRQTLDQGISDFLSIAFPVVGDYYGGEASLLETLQPARSNVQPLSILKREEIETGKHRILPGIENRERVSVAKYLMGKKNFLVQDDAQKKTFYQYSLSFYSPTILLFFSFSVVLGIHRWYFYTGTGISRKTSR